MIPLPRDNPIWRTKNQLKRKQLTYDIFHSTAFIGCLAAAPLFRIYFLYKYNQRTLLFCCFLFRSIHRGVADYFFHRMSSLFVLPLAVRCSLNRVQCSILPSFGARAIVCVYVPKYSFVASPHIVCCVVCVLST